MHITVELEDWNLRAIPPQLIWLGIHFLNVLYFDFSPIALQSARKWERHSTSFGVYWLLCWLWQPQDWWVWLCWPIIGKPLPIPNLELKHYFQYPIVQQVALVHYHQHHQAYLWNESWTTESWWSLWMRIKVNFWSKCMQDYGPHVMIWVVSLHTSIEQRYKSIA